MSMTTDRLLKLILPKVLTLYMYVAFHNALRVYMKQKLITDPQCKTDVHNHQIISNTYLAIIEIWSRRLLHILNPYKNQTKYNVYLYTNFCHTCMYRCFFN